MTLSPTLSPFVPRGRGKQIIAHRLWEGFLSPFVRVPFAPKSAAERRTPKLSGRFHGEIGHEPGGILLRRGATGQRPARGHRGRPALVGHKVQLSSNGGLELGGPFCAGKVV